MKKATFVTISMLFILTLPHYALVGPVPDTGQTKCYNNTEEIPCPQPGEPFYGQDGNYLINPPSYTKLDADGNDLPDTAAEWVMVRDNVTELIWEVKRNKDGVKNYNDPYDADNTYTWYDPNPDTNGGDAGTSGNGTDTKDFLEALNDAQLGGYSDWRLPTVKELAYMIDYSIPWPEPKINATYFPNTVPSRYWSSTSLSYGAKFAWYLAFGAGCRSDFYKYGDYYVRAVRGRSVSNQFIDNGDGTVTDSSTGLMWQKDTARDGQSNYDLMSWEEAFDYCESLSLGGHSDWRLPNIKEVSSLMDYSLHDPAIDTAYFPNTVFSGRGYRSSTTCANDPNDCSLGVNFVNGMDGWGIKRDNSSYVRAVRGGMGGSVYVNKDGTCSDQTPCYTTIQEAMSAAETGYTIKITQGVYNESIILNESKVLKLQGGWNSNFTIQSSYTTVSSMTISKGTIQADKIILQ
ncbi:MAG: DUF1566 domain-containing protein [Desulfobacteraceae bacterium]|nr:DUF1566 domain-containing protein [Desulfobacteraceae bacterium]